ncbi:MAG: dTDP-4-dehydrorhamnose reductase [Acidimicrobiaceae bacterium]|nr:dTDP-4-dehydrorhamnose reductase [Acidimicrobiaceae bacterium]
MTRTVLLIGGNGQLGHDLRWVWPEQHPGDRLISLGHADLEVTDRASVDAALAEHAPDLVINTAAFHKVDLIESTPEPAFQVNVVGARNVALACEAAGSACMFISSDYVFTDSGGRPHTEDDPVEPADVYGVSKAAGEMVVRLACRRHYVVRSCGLYGVAGASGKGGNFVETMLRLAASGKPIKVVDDQVMTPTPTYELARQLAALAGREAYGTYHATCQGQCSWYEFAAEIFRRSGLTPDLAPQSSAESGSAAPRPPYSVLENRNLRRLGIDVLPPWQDGLARYLDVRGS